LGALKMTLGSSSMMFQYINAAGTVLDSGTIPCHGNPVDTPPPTKPSGLTATLNSQAYVNLQWNASTDDTRVNSYTIYRNGAMLTTVGSQTLNYKDNTTQGSTTYSYQVDVFDLANNHSAQSTAASITTPSITELTITPWPIAT
jgi:hypothetical protein